MGNRELALALAREGWAVFPIWHCVDGVCACGKPERGQIGKHPRCKNGHSDATTDEAQIEVWWSDGTNAEVGFLWECSEFSNIGIAIPDGIVIVDTDPRNGGLETYAELLTRSGGLPETRTVNTSNGGSHRYYGVPAGTQYPAKAGTGVDVKQRGGYVLAPPSIHKSGTRYELALDVPIADAPEWLLALGKPRQERKEVKRRERGDHNDALSAESLKEADAIIALLEPEYVEGRRHKLANGFGGYCKKNGKSEAFVEYVVSQLPSTDPEMRVQGALTFYNYDKPQGWQLLEENLPKEALAQVETIVKARRARPGLGAARIIQRVAQITTQPLDPGVNPLDTWTDDEDPSAEIPPLDYLCEHFGIAEGKVSLFGGFAGSGKSPLGLLFGVCIASGQPFLGQAVTQRPVTFLMYEGERLSRIRRQRICRAMGIKPEEINLKLRRAFTGFDPTSLAVLRDAALWFRDANNGKGALFIHDTYTSAMRGIDQNSAEYADALWTLGDIGDETGAIHIALAHFKKSKDEDSDLQMLSGHNAIASAAQTVLGLLPNKKRPEEITIYPTRVPEIPFKQTTIAWSDVKDPKCATDSILARTHAAKWGLSCKVLEHGPTKEVDPKERIARDIYQALAAKPYGMTKAEIEACIEGKTATIGEVLQSMAAKKRLAFEKKGREHCYTLKK